MIDAWPTKQWVPDTCCIPASFAEDCGKSGNADIFYSNGCYHQIHMWFVQRLHIVGVVGLVVAFIQVSYQLLKYSFDYFFFQLFGLISSMLLFCTVRHKRNSRTYKSYQTHA